MMRQLFNWIVSILFAAALVAAGAAIGLTIYASWKFHIKLAQDYFGIH